MKIMISTFGEEPRGITKGLVQFNCKNLILLIPEELKTRKAKNGLNRIENFVKEGDIKLEKIKISPYSLMENIQKIKELIKSQEGNEVILNVTGGRKTLSLAATLAGFVTNPEKIIYIQQEDDKSIEIPRFTIREKILTKPKRAILESIKTNTTLEDIKKSLTNKSNKSRKYHTIKKHLRELAGKGLIRTNEGRPQTYNITPHGKLLCEL